MLMDILVLLKPMASLFTISGETTGSTYTQSIAQNCVVVKLPAYNTLRRYFTDNGQDGSEVLQAWRRVRNQPAVVENLFRPAI